MIRCPVTVTYRNCDDSAPEATQMISISAVLRSYMAEIPAKVTDVCIYEQTSQVVSYCTLIGFETSAAPFTTLCKK